VTLWGQSAGGFSVCAQLPDRLASGLLATARDAFSTGFQAAAAISAVLMAATAIVVTGPAGPSPSMPLSTRGCATLGVGLLTSSPCDWR
jgi:hypothetical protein